MNWPSAFTSPSVPAPVQCLVNSQNVVTHQRSHVVLIGICVVVEICPLSARAPESKYFSAGYHDELLRKGKCDLDID